MSPLLADITYLLVFSSDNKCIYMSRRHFGSSATVQLVEESPFRVWSEHKKQQCTTTVGIAEQNLSRGEATLVAQG